MNAPGSTHGEHAPRMRLLVRRGAAAGVVAAVLTTAAAAISRAADVALEVDGAKIPLAAFAMWTIVGAVLGVVLARLLGDRRRFVMVTVAATGLSLIPPIALPDDVSTKVVLVGAHLLAAAIIIPALSQLLIAPARNREAHV